MKLKMSFKIYSFEPLKEWTCHQMKCGKLWSAAHFEMRNDCNWGSRIGNGQGIGI